MLILDAIYPLNVLILLQTRLPSPLILGCESLALLIVK
jgi:hypothetical protein